MSCNQTLSGLIRDCEVSRGGVKAVYIADESWVGARTLTQGQISAITMNTHTVGEESVAYKFLKYYVRPESCSLTSTLNVDRANGVNYVSTDLVLQFVKMDTTKAEEMAALKVNDLAVIVQDANGKFWYLGNEEPVVATAGDGSTGQAVGDANKFGLTLNTKASGFPLEVTASAASAVIDTL